MVQRAPHEGGIGARLGEPFEVPRVSDPAAGHELGAWERATDLAKQADVGAGAGAHPGEVEDDDRSDPAAPCQLGDGDRREGAERRVGGDRLTGAEVEGEYGLGDLRSQSLERSARVGGWSESLEPHDHPRRAIRQKLTSLLGSRDTGIDPDGDVRSLGGNGAPERALRCAAGDGIEVCEIQLAESQTITEGPGNGQRVSRLTGRELRRKWRVTVTIARLGVHRSAAEYVQNRNYAHRRAAVIGYHGDAWVAK